MKKVGELEGEELAAWVARARGWIVECNLVEYEGEPSRVVYSCRHPEGGEPRSFNMVDGFRPDLNWEDGGPIIDREKINLIQMNGRWVAGFGFETYVEYEMAQYGLDFKQTGSTPLIAAMRAYVASKFGDEVSVGSAEMREGYAETICIPLKTLDEAFAKLRAEGIQWGIDYGNGDEGRTVVIKKAS